MWQFDYIVIGAGSAGCAVAGRLSEDPSVNVCLIEAGAQDTSPPINIPLGFMRLFDHKRLNWRYKTAPQEHASGRSIPVPRGKVLGGSSSINGMVYTRGHPSDYDDWARLGNPGWSFRDVLPYFRRSENNEDFPDSPYHGQGGPLNVKFLDSYNPLTEVLCEAAESLQYRRNADFCGETHEGFGRRQFTQLKGRRHSSAKAFIAPALGRPNLTVLTDTLVRRVVIEEGRATGVEIGKAGSVETLAAGKEVILSAGVIGSPQILMLSGIGDRGRLAAHGIALKHHLPGVGRNYRDHIASVVQYTSPTTVPYGLSWRTVPWAVWSVAQYALFRTGIFANAPGHSGGFIRTLPELTRPDVQFILIPAFRDRKGRTGIGHGFGLITIVLRPESRGEVRLASADPEADPVIDPQFFSAPEDVETLVRWLKIARRLINAPAFDPYRGAETDPGSAVRTDDQWRNFARDTAFTAYHPVGSCKMGNDAEAVVDAQLRVHGVAGLRVVDASIMPTLIGGNTNGPSIMIGEKAADMIRGRLPLPPAAVRAG